MRSNCLAYACKRFWREGGYIVVMWSPRWWGVHVRWTQDFVTFHEFVPVNPVRRIFPPLLFEGRERSIQP
jgi:hypothetical protein